MRAEVKPVTFRVYPENRSLYAVINIWPTKTAMYRHRPLGRDYQATTKGVMVYDVPPAKSGKPTRKRGLFAEINFCRACLGIGVVSHEMTHAAFCWAERRGLPLETVYSAQNWKANRKRNSTMKLDSVEERFCYALGEMCRQFTQRCYDLGLYREVVQGR